MSDYYDKYTPTALAELIQQCAKDLELMRTTLERKRQYCEHDWTEPKYTPIVREAYTDPGDPPGTMGSDWRGPMYVPRQETPLWSRECRKCKKREETTQTHDEVKKIPVFPGRCSR